MFVWVNGSGKTTLLKGLRDEYLGDITLEGYDVYEEIKR